MRTTLTLNDSVEADLRRYAARHSMRFKDAVNELLRNGLKHSEEISAEAAYKTEPKSLGLREGLSYDNVSELLEQTEGPQFR